MHTRTSFTKIMYTLLGKNEHMKETTAARLCFFVLRAKLSK